MRVVFLLQEDLFKSLQPMKSSGDKHSSQMLLVIESGSKNVDLPTRSLLWPEVLHNGEEVCLPFQSSLDTVSKILSHITHNKATSAMKSGIDGTLCYQ